MWLVFDYTFPIGRSSYHVCVRLAGRCPFTPGETRLVLKHFVCELCVAGICFCQQAEHTHTHAHTHKHIHAHTHIQGITFEMYEWARANMLGTGSLENK